MELNDDIISEIIKADASWRMGWISVSRRWRKAAYDALFAHLVGRLGGPYNDTDIKIVARYDITRMTEFINLHNRGGSYNLYGLLASIIRIGDDNLNYLIYSKWREWRTDIAKKMFAEGVESILDTHTECRLVDECGVVDPDVIGDIKSAITMALYEHNNYLFSGAGWRSPEAAIVIEYAIKHLPITVLNYIRRSTTYPVNWDADCLEQILIYPEVLITLTVEELHGARDAIANERKVNEKYGNTSPNALSYGVW